MAATVISSIGEKRKLRVLAMWAQVAREEPNRSSEICCYDLGSRFCDFGNEQPMS